MQVPEMRGFALNESKVGQFRRGVKATKIEGSHLPMAALYRKVLLDRRSQQNVARRRP